MSLTQALTRSRHALDPLSVEELASAVTILRSERGIGEQHRFVQINLHEPPKALVLATWGENGAGPEIEREAFAVVIDASERSTYQAIVSLTTGRVTSWERVAVGQPPLTFEELLACERACREHPEFRAAMHRRGISDLDLVWVDHWSPGAYDDELDHAHRRLARGLVWVKASPDDDNGYAHPIENVAVLIDLHEMTVIRVEDEGVVPVPMKTANYAPEDVGPLRPDLKPLTIIQAEGPSFEVEGHQVRWQKWRFRVGFTPREGLVLHMVGWEEGDRVRPILHRASLSEMVVPYGDPAHTHARKNAFDVGELNLGALANSL